MNIRLSALAALVLGTAASAADLDALRECAASRGYEITAVEEKPDYVKVAYVLRPTLESFIRCELAFPSGREWSGRFWGCGNGGPGGGVNVDVGIARRGDAVVHTDMGTSKGVYGRREVMRGRDLKTVRGRTARRLRRSVILSAKDRLACVIQRPSDILRAIPCAVPSDGKACTTRS